MAERRKKPAGGSAPAVVPLRPSRKCPVCGKPSVRAYYPFDSKRCADIDLAKWLTGSYAIPGAERPPDSDPDSGDEPGDR
jgi:uncharacterized protein